MSDQVMIDPNWSINEILQRHPEAVGGFNAIGIDPCCGGGASRYEAAYRDGAGPEALRMAVRRAAGTVGSSSLLAR
jgi:iron-sulfur cluster repair protein YtfE (RIC family)